MTVFSQFGMAPMGTQLPTIGLFRVLQAPGKLASRWPPRHAAEESRQPFSLEWRTQNDGSFGSIRS